MQLGSIVKGATYQTAWGHRFKVIRKGKSTVLGRWVSGPLKGKEGRILPSSIEGRMAEGQG